MLPWLLPFDNNLVCKKYMVKQMVTVYSGWFEDREHRLRVLNSVQMNPADSKIKQPKSGLTN